MAKSKASQNGPADVRRMVSAGVRIRTAIREAIGLTDTEFAVKYGRNRANVSAILNGKRAAAEADIDALITQCGGTELEWQEILHEAGAPTAEKAAS